MTKKCDTAKYRKLKKKCRENREQNHARVSAFEAEYQRQRRLRLQRQQEQAEWEMARKLRDPRRPYVQRIVNLIVAEVEKSPLVKINRILGAFGDYTPYNIAFPDFQPLRRAGEMDVDKLDKGGEFNG